jgi:DNA-binding LytR/AlgR family response regulator
MTSNKFNAIVVEDELVIRQSLIEGLQETEFFNIIGESGGFNESYEIITNAKDLHVIFFDIQIKGGSSLDLIMQLRKENFKLPPIVITAYDEYEYAKLIVNELRDLVICIVDKPFWSHWQSYQIKVLTYLRNYYQKNDSSIDHPRRKIIKIIDGRSEHLINLNDILAVKTGDKGQGKTQIITIYNTIDINQSLLHVASQLSDKFIQISRFEYINY